MQKVIFKGYYFKKGIFWICWYYGESKDTPILYSDNVKYLTIEQLTGVYDVSIKLTEKSAIKWISKTGLKLSKKEQERQAKELYSLIQQEQET